MNHVAGAVLVVLGAAACAGDAPAPSPPRASAAGPAHAHASVSADRVATVPALDEDHDLLVTTEQCEGRTSARVRREDVVAELPIVERIVRDGYSGFDAAAERGVDWAGIFSGLKRKAALLPDTIEAEAYGELLAGALEPARDANLTTVVQGTRDGKPLWIVRSARGLPLSTGVSDVLFRRDGNAWRIDAAPPAHAARVHSCEDIDVDKSMRRTLVDKPMRVRHRLVVTHEDRVSSVTCNVEDAAGRLERRTFELRPLRSKTWPHPRPPFSLERRGEIVLSALMQLGSFPHGGERTRSALEDALGDRGLDRFKPRILDLRGTQTESARGQESYAELSRTSLGEMAFPGPSIDTRRSAVVAQGKVNDLRCLIPRLVEQEAKRVFTQDAADALAKLELDRRERAGGMPQPREIERTPWGTPKTSPPALVAVVDEACGGVCEDTLTILSNGTPLVVVGQRTAGTGRERRPMPYRLPRSGLWLHVPSSTFVRPKAAAADGAYEPDFYIDVDDPLPIVTELTKCLAKPACKRTLAP